MRSVLPVLLSALATATALTGCGSGGGTIARTDADALQSSLDGVTSAVSSGKCNVAAAAVENVRSHVQNLTGSIPARLQRNLEQGVTKLAAATPGDCADVVRQQQQQTTTTDTTPTTTTTEATTTTATTDTTTTPTTDTTTTPTTTTQTGGVSPEPSTSTTTTTTAPPPGNGSGGASGGGDAQGNQP